MRALARARQERGSPRAGMPEEEEHCTEAAPSRHRTRAALAGGCHRDPVLGCLPSV